MLGVGRLFPRERAAFTLVELLVVLVIIAILMGITFSVSKFAIHRAKTARHEVMVAKIRSALDDYRATYGEYPVTPMMNTNGGHVTVLNLPDVRRHYPDNFPTECNTTSNSPYTNLYLASSGTVETITLKGNTIPIDYSLTYPLMLRQLAKGMRPLMEFDRVTVAYLVWRTLRESSSKIKRWSRSGWRAKTLYYISGDPIHRAKAIDPMSGKQWKYECPDGVTYSLTTNSFR